MNEKLPKGAFSNSIQNFPLDSLYSKFIWKHFYLYTSLWALGKQNKKSFMEGSKHLEFTQEIETASSEPFHSPGACVIRPKTKQNT